LFFYIGTVDQLKQQFVFPSVLSSDPVFLGAGNLKAVVFEKVKAWGVVAVDVAEELMQEKYLKGILNDDFQGLVGISVIPVFLSVDQNTYTGPLVEGINLEQVDAADGSGRFVVVVFQIDHHA